MSSLRPAACAALASFVSLVALACGGASSSGIDPTGSAAAPDGGGGAGQDGQVATYTLDDVCERTAPRICAPIRRACS